MRLTSGKKPISSMRSASSSTKNSTLSSFTIFWPIKSHRRPGVAMRISTPRSIASTCGTCDTPPKMTAALHGM